MPMSRVSCFVTVALASILSSLLAPAAARAAESADAHLRKGFNLMKQNRDEEALVEFKQAYKMFPSAKAAAEMGMAESSLKRWVDAEDHLLEARDQETDDWVKINRGLIDKEIGRVRAHIGTLAVKGTPSAELLLNSVRVGSLPLRGGQIRVAEGEVTLRARLDGYETLTKVWTVIGDERSEVELWLSPTKSADPAATAAANPVAPVASPAPNALPVPDASPVATAKPSKASGHFGPFTRMLPVFVVMTGLSTAVSAWTLPNEPTNVDWICRNNKSPDCRASHPDLMVSSALVGISIGATAALGPPIYAILSPHASKMSPSEERWAILFLGGASSASAMLVGGLMTYYEGFGETWKRAAGISALSLGVATAAVTTIAAFEPVSTGGDLHVSLVPTPNGLAVFGRF